MMPHKRKHQIRGLLLLAGIAVSVYGTARAETLAVMVHNSKGQAVEGAVVYVVSTPEGVPPGTGGPKVAIIDQVDKEFIGRVTPVQTGTDVEFPNFDEIRHHVYSFSPAKRFELPLYLGTPAKPVQFGKAGVVSLGCNIHDWMSAYILVLDTPFFAVTDPAGKAVIDGLQPGEYQVEVWDRNMLGKSDKTVQPIRVAESSGGQALFKIRQKKVWRPYRAPTISLGGYR